jgi:hypothetical protein
MRRLCVFGVVIVAAVTGPNAPHAQTPAATQRVWTGTWEEHDAWEGSNVVGRSQARITYVYVQGRDEFGGLRWESRRLTWSAHWEETRSDQMIVDKVGTADERGLYQNRYSADIVTACTGSGTLELGPAVAGSGDDLTPEQKAHLLAPCVTTYQPRESGVPTPPPAPTDPRALLQVLGMPNEDELVGCAYEKTWPKGGRPAGSFSVSVSTPLGAVMEVSRRAEETYARFVPAPGATLTFTASVPSGTARFRFELDADATSHFPGYATNANIDDAFRASHELAGLPGGYANDGPDVIFHPKHYSAQDWSRVEPLVVESAKPQSAVVVTVTTLDYGAVGRLRAFAKSEDCGSWQPVSIKFYPDTREFIAIPMDEDNNLMADGLEEYSGRQSGADDDAEPRGNGMAGDGLTVFEEYRGFLINATACSDTLLNQHVRTSPRSKDVFVHTLDPDYVQVLPLFAWSSGLAVHGICEPQYVDNDTRIVNFTLQTAQVRRWRSSDVSGEVPQHGIHLENTRLPDAWPFAITCSDVSCLNDSPIGPPAKTFVIWIDKTQFSTTGSALARSIAHTVTHELGHAVGIPHHNDTVANWEIQPGRQDLRGGMVIAPGGDCVDPESGTTNPDIVGMYLDDTFVGCQVSCVLVLQHGQRSGETECPMRYSYGTFHEAPGSDTRRTGDVRANRASTGDSGPTSKFPFWTGRFLRYDNDNDVIGLRRLCRRPIGTGLNDTNRADGNHAGDAARSCADHVVVNDSVLPRGRQ